MGEDWDRDDVVDLDVTGDPQLDQFGYQSPKQRGGTIFTASPERDWLAQAKADRAERERRWLAALEQNLTETRRRVAAWQQPDQLPPHVARAVDQGARTRGGLVARGHCAGRQRAVGQGRPAR